VGGCVCIYVMYVYVFVYVCMYVLLNRACCAGGGLRPVLEGYPRVLTGYSTALAGDRRRWSTGWVLAGTPGTARVLERNGCCGTAEGPPRRVVPSCAGAYVSGAAGSNECPAGFVRIETEAACRAAADAAGKTFSVVVNNPYLPRGCLYWTEELWAYLNAHAVGVDYSDRQLLCAALSTIGARVPAR
jgi:hypothetical protein